MITIIDISSLFDGLCGCAADGWLAGWNGFISIHTLIVLIGRGQNKKWVQKCKMS